MRSEGTWKVLNDLMGKKAKSTEITKTVVCKMQGPAHFSNTFQIFGKFFSVIGKFPFYPDDDAFYFAYVTFDRFQEFDNVTKNFNTF